MNVLITTILNRPYVVAFLISYIIIAVRRVGWRWTLSYLIVGYTIAFASEYLSINYGFPYGWYFYKYENLAGEWLNHGVPVWDSVSYVFMCFAGLCLAAFFLRGKNGRAHFEKGPPGPPQGAAPTQMIILSAIFTTLLDVIVDPVAHRGSQWFLGDIYYYPHPGIYFNVTMANFAGWFLVSFLINAIGVYVLKFDSKVKLNPTNNFLGLGLYFGIFGFGMGIAVWIGAWTILLADVFWLTLVIAMLWPGRRVR